MTALDDRIAANMAQIERCRYPSGLFSAVPPDSPVKVDLYRNVWIRDSVYTLLAFEAIGDIERLRAGVHALLDRVLLRWQYRLDWRIVDGVPDNEVEYLHPRFAPDGSELDTELWGLRQDDAVGLAVWALCRWQERFEVFRNDYVDFHLVQKLIWYLDRTGVPHLPDSGVWEEEGATKTVHLSSLAPVAAGLTQAARIGVADIPERLRQDVLWKIDQLAGRESDHHDTDLALLTLIWPLGDDLPIARSVQRAIVELDRLHGVANDAGEYPESWCRDPEHYQFYNSPLCWSHALDVVACSQLGQLAAARSGGRQLHAAPAPEPVQQAGLSSR
jgi:GH15 family glucan-1,4-alpha-glucosidase